MNPEKQHRKLEKLQLKAEECLTREEAQKIIKKADKAHRKLEEGWSKQQPSWLLSIAPFNDFQQLCLAFAFCGSATDICYRG